LSRICRSSIRITTFGFGHRHSADVLYTDAINGVPAMWLEASIRSAGLAVDHLPRPLKRGTDHLPPGIKPWKNVWSAGQGIGLINDIPPVAELVRRLQSEYLTACSMPDMRSAVTEALRSEGV
jgi:nitronate monooxygenase